MPFSGVIFDSAFIFLPLFRSLITVTFQYQRDLSPTKGRTGGPTHSLNRRSYPENVLVSNPPSAIFIWPEPRGPRAECLS